MSAIFGCPTGAAADPIASWVDLAACRGRDTRLWFRPATSLECQVALAVCRRCPVRADCLAAALDEERDAFDRRFGVRGGMTGAERFAVVSAR